MVTKSATLVPLTSRAEDWEVSSDKALTISINGPGETAPVQLMKFHPDMTYQIFGEDSMIRGYKKLHIDLRLAAHDGTPQLDVRYERRQDLDQIVDVFEEMEKWLPEDVMTDTVDFDKLVQETDYNAFKPPGKLLTKYTASKKNMEVYVANLTDPKCRQIFANMQILGILFIEGASMIDFDDQEDWDLRRWDVYFLYERTPDNLFIIHGYCTVYKFYFIDSAPKSKAITNGGSNGAARQTTDPALAAHIDSSRSADAPDPDSFPIRARIAQFLLLPPSRGHTHGSRLYDAVMSHLTNPTLSPNVREICVEDPNDKFDRLRTLRDLNRLLNDDQRLLADATVESVTSGRYPIAARARAARLAPKHFRSILEMHLLHEVIKAGPPLPKDKLTVHTPYYRRTDWTKIPLYKKYREWVKKRVYRKNVEGLAQLDKTDRHERLHETYIGLEESYLQMIAMGAAWPGDQAAAEEYDAEEGDEDGYASGDPGRSERLLKGHGKGKRRLSAVGEEDEWEDEDMGDYDGEEQEMHVGGASSSKGKGKEKMKEEKVTELRPRKKAKVVEVQDVGEGGA